MVVAGDAEPGSWWLRSTSCLFATRRLSDVEASCGLVVASQQMKAIPLIRASAAVHVAAFLRQAGIPPSTAWEGAGLPPAALGDPARLVALRSTLQFFEDAAIALGIDDLGGRVARQDGLLAVGPFGRAMLSAPTLYAAMQAAVTHIDGHNSGATYWIAPEGSSVRFCRRFRVEGTAFRQADLFSLELMLQLVRRVAGGDWQPGRITLQSTGPDAAVVRRQLALLPSCEILAGRRATSVRVPRSLLARSPVPDVAASARADAAHWSGPPLPRDFAGSFELVVESILGNGQALLGAAAQAAGTEVRTLQRHLAAAGMTFRDVVHRVRLRKATELLEHRANRVIDVAQAVGYSDTAHFTRAFRRWTSMTPVEYRRLRRSEGAVPLAIAHDPVRRRRQATS